MYEYIVEAANQMFALLRDGQRSLREERRDLMEVLTLGAMTLDVMVRDQELLEAAERVWQRRREPRRDFGAIVEDSQSFESFLNGERELLVSNGMDSALVDLIIDEARRDASNLANLHPEAIPLIINAAHAAAYHLGRQVSEQLWFQSPTPSQQILTLQSQQQALQQQVIALHEQQMLLHRQIEALRQQDQLEQDYFRMRAEELYESQQRFFFMQSMQRWLQSVRRRREALQRQERLLQQQGSTLQQVQEELRETRQILQQTQEEQRRLLERVDQQQGDLVQTQAEGEYEQHIDTLRRHARTACRKVSGAACIAFNLAVDTGTVAASFGVISTPIAITLSVGLGINWISD